MSDNKSPKTEEAPLPESNAASQAEDALIPTTDNKNTPKEVGGRDGLDPTRFGDWEKNGRCIDF